MLNEITITDEQKTILNNFLDSIDYTSCYFVGSATVPFIHNKHDLDIAIIVDKSKVTLDKDSRKYFRANGLDIHLVDLDFFTKKTHWNNLFICHYSGETLDNLITLPLDNINATKQNILDIYNKVKSVDYNGHESFIYKNKIWYYSCVLMCYVKNNSYDLTEEQIENINILHDREEKDLEKRTKLIDDMMKELESW